MSLTRASIERDRVTWTGLLIIIIGGLMAYLSLPRAEDPGFEVRTAMIMTVFPGASPARVESLITDRIEAEVQQIPELDYVNSESRTGVSVVYVNIKESVRGMRPIWDDLRRKMDNVRADMPEGTIGPMVNDDLGDVYGIVLAMTGDGYTVTELEDAADQVRDELLRLDEVARVEVYGAQEQQIFIEFNSSRLAEVGLSPGQLASLLDAQNIVVSGGQVTVGPERLALEPTGSFEELDDLRRMVITTPRGDMLFLEDIATVERGTIDPPSALMRWEGQPAVGLGVSLRKGGNVLALGEQVDDLLRRMESVNPLGLDLHVMAFQPAVVEKKVDEFVGSLLQALALVLVVMLIFLGLRTGLVVASLIPATILATLLVMLTFGVGIDQVSLAALIIALGMLVDNAIVMSESIMVAMEEGKAPLQAAVDSADELRIPLLVSSLTTAAAFLPIYLAESSAGEYTAPLFYVVTIALIASWLLALTLIPMLCVLFIRVTPRQGEGYDSRFYDSYRKGLGALLRRPWLALAGLMLVFVLSLVGLGKVPQSFFPPSDRPLVLVDVDTPGGSTIEYTHEVVRAIEAYTLEELTGETDLPEVLDVTSFIGGDVPHFALTLAYKPKKPNYAFMVLNTSERGQVAEVHDALTAYVGEHFPGVELRSSALEMGPPVGKPIALRVSGRDEDQLFSLVDEVRAQLRETGLAVNISDDWGPRTKKLVVRIDEARARMAGVTNKDIAISLQTSLSGIPTTEFREGADVLPVTLRSVAADRQDLGKLENLAVFAQQTGRSVPLSQVADVELVWEASNVLRRDRTRTVTLTADLAPGHSVTEVLDRINPWLDAQRPSWDLGYDVAVGGEFEQSARSNEAIAVKLPIAALAIVLLLVFQFNSMRKTGIVLATLPLGLIGVSFGLLAARSYFGFMTVLGVVSLFGIIINNAVVLLDRIDIEINQFGRSAAEAVMEAGVRRLRPILLTTGTTVMGLVPLWTGGGPMWEPMAISIIFGLLFATVLTLGGVPVMYTLLYRIRHD